MSTKSLPNNKSTEKKVTDIAGNANSPINQTFMSGGLKGWLENVTTRNQSEDSINPILPEPQHRRAISASSGVESRHPGLQSRNTSRGNSQLTRAKSSHKVSQNPASIPGPKTRMATPNQKRFRRSAVVPFLLSATAFSLSLVLISAGSKTGYMTDVNIISFNTTDLGDGIIEFTPTTSTTATSSATSTSAGLKKRQTLAPTTITTAISTMISSKLVRREAFDPLDPLGLISGFSSFVVSRVSVDSSVLASGGSAIASALPLQSISLPGLPSPTSLTSGNGSTTTGVLGDLGSLITGVLTSLLSSLAAGLGTSGITQAIDDSLNKVVTDLISSLISEAGIQDYYSLYIMTTCQGSSSSNISSCSSFSSAANSISDISAKVPSSLVVVGTNVSSPALGELTTAVSTLGPTVDSLEKFLLALMILSLINSAAATLLSFLGILLPRHRGILYANLSLTSVGILTRSIDAILATTISATLSFVTNKFGNALGVSATIGGIFIALIWLGFVCQLVASCYWVCVWFVEFRQISFRIREREASEIGDYAGIVQEIKSDVRSPRQSKEQEKPFVAV
ncbi:uncharacterized protein PAC_12484 [Phialocephala subalpina]|uniref:Uncharacterized protein n=1 Tax=Phialocephala subalpina TaxID=576137 RepID=A0A1L7XC93_9HELO|nr:uncharacterized protein PAC_12484 [Phialocephala subalpina]